LNLVERRTDEHGEQAPGAEVDLSGTTPGSLEFASELSDERGYLAVDSRSPRRFEMAALTLPQHAEVAMSHTYGRRVSAAASWRRTEPIRSSSRAASRSCLLGKWR
jgi:hypothetical protein